MSLSNLGKNLKDAGSILDIFKEAQGHLGDTVLMHSALDAMSSIFDKMNTDDAIRAFQKLGLEGDVLTTILENCGMGTDEIAEKLNKLGSSGKSGEKFITKLGNAFTGLMSKINPVTKGIALATAALAAVTLAVNAYNDYVQESVATAKQEGEAWTEKDKSLDGYISRIDRLRTALDSGNLSEDAAYNAKSELFAIQQQLISTYGDYAAGINLVNGSLEEQIALVKQLAVTQANDYLEDNSVGIAKATKEMTKQRNIILGQFANTDYLQTDGIKSVVEKYSDYLSTAVHGSMVTIRFKGDVTEAESVIDSFLQDLEDKSSEYKDADLFEGLIASASAVHGEMTGILNEYQGMYETALKAQAAADTREYYYRFKERKNATEWMSDYATAVEKYNEALASGDSTAISAAAEEFGAIDTQIQWLINNTMPQYAYLMKDISAQLNNAAILAERCLSPESMTLVRSN